VEEPRRDLSAATLIKDNHIESPGGFVVPWSKKGAHSREKNSEVECAT